MSQAPKDTRKPAEKARDTAGIIGSFRHEGYVPNAEDEAIHQQAERGDITTEEAIAIFRERAHERERKALRRKRPAIMLDYTLVTDNESKFARISGLRIENWLRK
jgi:hypothetical protein